MASIYKEVTVEVDGAEAWAALRLAGEPHKLFAPVLADAKLTGDTRTVTFTNGPTVRERILDVDDERRRMAYAALDGPGIAYHHASMQIVDAGPGRCRFIWVTDFMPQEIGGSLSALIDLGAQALKKNLEQR